MAAAQRQKAAGRQAEEGKVMSLGGHLEELRRRVIYCILAVVGAAIICWFARYRLLDIVKMPHIRAMEYFGLESSLRYAGYFDPVAAQLKLSLVAAVVLTSPFILYHIWAFVAPGLFPNERYRVVRIGLASLVCFLAGICFGYFAFIPLALRYMVLLAGPGTEPVLMIDKYLSLFFMLTLAMAIAFQTPVIIAYLIRWGILSPDSLHEHRNTAIVVAFVLGAIFTPPDPLTQIMMGLTLVVLYDLGGLIAAPSRRSILGFARFAGAIVLVVGAVVAYTNYWPVAQVEARRGLVSVSGQAVPTDQPQGMRRGARCTVGPQGLAAILFGSENAQAVYLAGESEAMLHAPEKVALLRGQGLFVSPQARKSLEVYAGPATLEVAGARAEVVVPDQDRAIVTALEGDVTAVVEGSEKRIRAGHSRTFQRGGEPADTTDAEQRWRRLLGGEAQEQQ